MIMIACVPTLSLKKMFLEARLLIPYFYNIFNVVLRKEWREGDRGWKSLNVVDMMGTEAQMGLKASS